MKKRKYFYVYTIRRNDPSTGFMSGWHWMEAGRNFPYISTPFKWEAKLFDTEDEADRFYLKKGKKYRWLWRDWWVCRIRVWVKGNRIMIGEHPSRYTTKRTAT